MNQKKLDSIKNFLNFFERLGSIFTKLMPLKEITENHSVIKALLQTTALLKNY